MCFFSIFSPAACQLLSYESELNKAVYDLIASPLVSFRFKVVDEGILEEIKTNEIALYKVCSLLFRQILLVSY